jgi:phage tail sheath protein FI
MATYNKPGVYVEETLTPNLPVVQTEASSVAAFIGVADRGPTAVVSGAVLATPTLVTNFSDFTRQFSFDNVVNTFSGANVGTSAEDLKYAVKTFFDNGGGQAYIVRAVNTDAVKATAVLRNSNSQTVQAVAWSFDGTTNIASNKLTITATSGTPFASFEAGRLVNFAGVTATNYTFLNSSTWVVSAVESSGAGLSVAWKNASPVTAVSQTTGVTVSGGAPSSVATLTATAKDHGAWAGNGSDNKSIWVGVEPDSTENLFNLSVYYSTTATTSTELTATNRVERFTSLSMDSTNARYFVNIIGSNSNWITVSDNAAATTGRYDLPAFTGYWGTATTSANISGVDGSFVWNTASFSTATLSAAKLGKTGTTVVTLAGVAGSDGSTAPTLSSQVLARLDAVSSPLILNYPNVSTTATINGLLSYAATRGDSFVVIDAKNDTVANVLSTTADVGIGSYTNNLNYGAAYYPYIVIADPASTTGATKTVGPGGAVAALYASTDAARGVFKAPAGSNALVRSAVSVPALTSEEFDLISGSTSNLNVIRFVPGSGICVMGARTLSSLYSDKYVPVRRTLNYLSNTLKNSTAFAVFEPNNATLWNTVTGTVRGILSDFWNDGGLFGSTESEAFYVKCDATINTSQVIAAGELRIEVGVALLRPAEFVIIKLGQIDGGATVTTSI